MKINSDQLSDRMHLFHQVGGLLKLDNLDADLMGKNAIVAGTGFEGRANIIRRYIKEGMPVQLVREPKNPYDPYAIAVLILVPRMLGLLGNSQVKIGYIKAGAAKGLAEKIDAGIQVLGWVESFFAPDDIEHPRVSLRLEWPDA